MSSDVEAPPFGAALRQLRREAGLSLAGLARRLHYSKSYLSRIENGHRQPSPQLARHCDTTLGAEGALASLVPDAAEVSRAPLPPGHPEHWPPVAAAGADLDGIEAEFRSSLASARFLGRQVRPGLVLPVVAGHTNALIALGRADHRPGRPLLALAARCAEFAGWMAQESGGWSAAAEWTTLAADLAGAAGDTDLLAYTAVRQAELALYEGRGHDVLRWAERAREVPGAGSRVRAHALLREAQGHALAGSGERCDRALDQGIELLHAASSSSPDLGSTTVTDLGAATAGWCFADLGRYEEASALLARVVASIPSASRRVRAVFGARLSATHAAAGRRDLTDATCRQVLGDLRYTASASALVQLRTVERHLRRWPGHRSSQRLYLELAPMLSGGTTECLGPP
jgi:transcriptional regulator with XRE-family HTH domain